MVGSRDKKSNLITALCTLFSNGTTHHRQTTEGNYKLYNSQEVRDGVVPRRDARQPTFQGHFIVRVEVKEVRVVLRGAELPPELSIMEDCVYKWLETLVKPTARTVVTTVGKSSADVGGIGVKDLELHIRMDAKRIQ